MLFLAQFSSSATLDPFKLEELQSVCETLGVEFRIYDTPSLPMATEVEEQPRSIVWIELPSIYVARQVAKRCVLLKYMCLCFACADTFDKLVEEVKIKISLESAAGMTIDDTISLDNALALSVSAKDSLYPALTPLLGAGLTYKYTIDPVCRKFNSETKMELIEKFSVFGSRGRVCFSRPDLPFTIISIYSANDPLALLGAAFALPVAVSTRLTLLDFYSLKRRPYIGTTSMPPELTFLMANLARVRPGSLTIDPFCGTGSHLISCAQSGAFAVGSDMDGPTMRGGTQRMQQSSQVVLQQRIAMRNWLNSGLTPEEIEHPDMCTNFKVYNLPPPERLRLNFSQWRYAIRSNVLFDAIVSDPPYGVREKKKAVKGAGGGSPNINSSTEQGERSFLFKFERGTGMYCKVLEQETTENYDISTMISELILFAGKHLRVGGRLVFWLPTTYHYTADELPRHPYLRLVSAHVQEMTLKLSRVLVTMERVERNEPLHWTFNGGREIELNSIAEVTAEMVQPAVSTENLRDLQTAEVPDDNEAYKSYKQRRHHSYQCVKKFKDGAGKVNKHKRPVKETEELTRSEILCKNRMKKLNLNSD